MNKTFITTAVVGLIILVGGVLVFSGNSTNSEPMSDNRSDQAPTTTQSTNSETNMGTTTQPATTEDETSQSGTSSVSDDESVQPPSESAGADSTQATTVRYTSNGFSPESVTISQGETVKFVNETNSDMWVGSDQHPTHTQYAGTSIREHCPDNGDKAFDQCENGEEYSFTFEKTGSWTYHNHSQASDGGTVTVQ